MTRPVDPVLLARVKEDIHCFKENGVDLNPYSTVGARWSWQNGFQGIPKHMLDFSDCYERGKLAAILIKDAR